jgi:hypothetical protein
MMKKFQAIVIIGAPRSGTNMLRDLLTNFSGAGTWPCDEINYIWRHGNLSYPTDEFPAELACPSVVAYVNGEIERLAQSCNLQLVVEKTCANSLRVEYVDRILPDARYLYIVRDGVDVVASARKRWKAKLDLPYLLRKVRYVPLSDLPYYAVLYFRNRLYRLCTRENRLAYWGPKFKGLNELLAKHTLAEVCALQWQRCVDRADEAFERIEMERFCRISYESFVSNPVEELSRIAQFVGVEFDSTAAVNWVSEVSSKSVGKGRRELGQEKVAQLEKLVGATLRRHGYIN